MNIKKIILEEIEDFGWMETSDEDLELQQLIDGAKCDFRTTQDNPQGYTLCTNSYVETTVDDRQVRRWIDGRTENIAGNTIANFYYHYTEKGYTEEQMVNLWTRYMYYLDGEITKNYGKG